MNKNRIKLNICGTECVITSDDTESYVRSVGDEVENAIHAITEKNGRVSITMAAIITALSFCDDAHRATAAADNLRSQIKDYLEDSSRARLESDEARREIERMKREIQTLRARLSDEPKPIEPPLKEKPTVPVQRLSETNLQTGSYTRPQQAPSQKEADADGFMSFFEKKEND